MGAPTFTPGPWEIIGDDANQGVPFIAIGAGEMGTSTYRNVCEVYGNGDDLELTDEDRAQAHLIAAAPALYGALDRALELAADLEEGGRVFSPEQLAEIRRFEAVLAQARGEQL